MEGIRGSGLADQRRAIARVRRGSRAPVHDALEREGGCRCDLWSDRGGAFGVFAREFGAVGSHDLIDGDGLAEHPAVGDRRVGVGHGQRGYLVGAEHDRRESLEWVAVGAMHTERSGGILDLAQVEL